MRMRTTIAVAALLALALAADGAAAPAWVRVSSPNFTVVSNSGERSARGVAWQFEQVRAVLQRLWPWARLDTGRPVLVFAVKDEASVRALAPSYWEQKGGLRPATLFLNAADRHYVVVRTDVEVSRQEVNPYRLAYWSYVGIVLDATFGRPLPPWFTRGLAEVMSNTIVRTDDLTIGQIVPWHLQRLRRVRPVALDQVLGATRESKYLVDDAWSDVFDASVWALVHYLMFGEQGNNLSKFNKAASAVLRGADPGRAVADAFGGLPAVSAGYERYVTQTMFNYRSVGVDVDLQMEKFAGKALGTAEAAATRALFLAANGRSAEVGALLAEARRDEPGLAMAFEAEGLLADRTRNAAAAREAYRKAAEAGGASYYAEYRNAYLSWPEDGDPKGRETFARMAASLERAVNANPTFAPARDLLARTLLELDRPAEAWPHVQRAMELAPSTSYHQMTAARALWALNRPEEAKQAAAKARALATDDEDRREAQDYLDFLAKAGQQSAAQAASADRQRTLAKDCEGGAAEACREYGALAEAACDAGQAQACLVLGQLTERGLGRPANPVEAASRYEAACAAGVQLGCLAQAMLQWRGLGVPQDAAAAAARFASLCEGALDEACTQYAVAVSSQPSPGAIAQARSVFEARCKAGSARACAILNDWPK